jgi:hypothetical protein
MISGEMFSGFSSSPQLNLCHVRMMPTMDDERDTGLLTLPLTQFDTALYAKGVFMVGGASATTNSLFTGVVDVGVQAKVLSVHLPAKQNIKLKIASSFP